MKHSSLTNKIASTPLESNVCLTPLEGTPLSDTTLYWYLVGNLVYLIVTQLDIPCVVHLVRKFLAAPQSTHYELFYVFFAMSNGPSVMVYIIRLLPFVSCVLILLLIGLEILTERHSSYCFFLGDLFISWHSKKQTVTARLWEPQLKSLFFLLQKHNWCKVPNFFWRN